MLAFTMPLSSNTMPRFSSESDSTMAIMQTTIVKP